MTCYKVLSPVAVSLFCLLLFIEFTSLYSFAQLPCARGRVKIVRNGNLNWETGQYDPNGPGRTVLTDQGTMLRASNAWFYFDGGSSRARWTKDREGWRVPRRNGLNAVRLAVNHYNLGLTWEQFVAHMDNFVNWAQEEHIYLLITYTPHQPGTYDFARAKFFWERIAPRYKDRTHVLYEINNEPVAWTPAKYTDQTIKDLSELYTLVRRLAPQTHISILTIPMLPKDQLGTAINVINKHVAVDWTNTSVAFHSYHVTSAWQMNELKKRYPVINTEFCDPSSELNKPLDGMLWHEQAMERLKISWMNWTINSLESRPKTTLVSMLNDARTKGYIWTPDNYLKCPITTSVPTPTPTPTSIPLAAPFRIEAGSNLPFVDNNGNTWLADSNFLAGSILNRGNVEIANTDNDKLYQTERFGMSGYNFKVANGTYVVNLHFAETFSGITAAGQRVFDVDVEGNKLSNLDIFAEVGFNSALVKTFVATVTDGSLNINFTAKTQRPLINAIEVFVDDIAPSAPINLHTTAVTANNVSLGWSPATDNVAVAVYELYSGTKLIASTPNTSFNISGLQSGVSYSFVLQAKDASGNRSPLSNTVVVTTLDNVTPSVPTNLKIASKTANSVTLSWDASTDNVGIAAYEVYQNRIRIATVSTTSYTAAGLVPGTYSYAVTAIDATGNVSALSNTVDVAIVAAIPTIRIEAGSNADYVDALGNRWLADYGFTAGSILDRGSISIANTTTPRLYQTERFGMTGYAVKVANGNYTVKLHFAETFAGITAPQQRVFHVNVEGIGLSNIDVFKETGGRNRAMVKSFAVIVKDGVLNIGFTAVVQRTLINAIEITPR
jgi:chitodextrinase